MLANGTKLDVTPIRTLAIKAGERNVVIVGARLVRGGTEAMFHAIA